MNFHIPITQVPNYQDFIILHLLFFFLLKDFNPNLIYCVISPVSTYVFCSVTQSCLTLVTSWTVTHQAPLSMGFFRQEY